MSVGPVDNSLNLSERIAAVLRARIAEGALPEGSRLQEPHLAEEFNVSRNPIRRALETLCAEGMAERIPNKGVRVKASATGRKRRTTRKAAKTADLRTLSEQVYDRLLERILLPENRHVRTTVAELARELDVSRSPVQRALDQLARLGLVALESRRGVSIGEVDLARVAEVYEVRAELEGMAAERAAERMEPERVAKLIRINRDLQSAGPDSDRRALVSQEFLIHQEIADSCGQAYLKKLLDDAFALVSAFQRAGYGAPAMAREALKEHGRILEAIRACDGRLARQRMVRHIRATSRRIRSDGRKES